MGLHRFGIAGLAAELEDGEQQGAFDQDEDDDRPADGGHEDVVHHPGEIGPGIQRGLGIVLVRATDQHQQHEDRQPCPEGRTGNESPEPH